MHLYLFFDRAFSLRVSMKTIPSYRKSWISDITRTKTSLRNHYQLSTDNLIPKHFRTFLYRMFQNVISDNPPKIQGTSGKIHGIGRFTYIFMVDFWMAKFLGKYIARFGPMDASHSLLEDVAINPSRLGSKRPRCQFDPRSRVLHAHQLERDKKVVSLWLWVVVEVFFEGY